MKTISAEKKLKLEGMLSRLDSLAVAFSGGVDSTFLLATAKKCLGKKVLAVTVDTVFYPRRERVFATRTAAALGVEHVLLTLDLLGDPLISGNTAERCYFCKRSMLTAVAKAIENRSIEALAHGANLDDQTDYRPGERAASELGVMAPLAMAGMTKSDIRYFSRQMGLDSWRKPAMACLASRIPYGTVISPEALGMIEKAEELLQDLGFSACRVRHHGEVARIEVAPSAFHSILKDDMRIQVVKGLLGIGYAHVSLDLEGYRQGSMNRKLSV